MIADPPHQPRFVRVVLADANVLYSRVIRDYLLYAATQGVLQIRWSRRILDEMAQHLMANNPRIDRGAAECLLTVMNSTFPTADVLLDDKSLAETIDLQLPDEGDRHVVSAAIATSADVLCTDNLNDFPVSVMNEVGIEVLSADALLSRLIEEFPGEMMSAHTTAVRNLVGATSRSTVDTLRCAGAPVSADLVEKMLQP